MVRSILGVIAGLVVGYVLLSAVQALGIILYPPEGVDLTDQEALRAAIVEGKIALGAMAFVLLAHALGSLAGGWLAVKIARRAWLMHGFVVGGIFMITGIINLFMVPHPTWFTIADLFMFIPPALLGGLLARTRSVA